MRPEFQNFTESEAKTLALVEDMAKTLESVAVNKYHTPYLYSVFLRALLASKIDGSRPNSPRPTTAGPVLSANDSTMQSSQTAYPQQGPESPSRNGFNMNSNDIFGLEMYKSLGENYGDVSAFVNPFDMSNPTQTTAESDLMGHFNANTVGMDQNGPMSLDSLLTPGFWDSMLVPGTYILQSSSEEDLYVISGFSDTLGGMSGGVIYGPGGSGVISRWHSPRQTPKGENGPLPGGMTPVEVS